MRRGICVTEGCNKPSEPKALSYGKSGTNVHCAKCGFRVMLQILLGPIVVVAGAILIAEYLIPWVSALLKN